MLGHVHPFEARQAAHADIVELGEEKGVDEMPAVDRELRVVDRFLRDLEPGRTRTEESSTPSPIEFHFSFARTRDQIWQVETKKVVAFNHIGVALPDEGGQTLQRGPLRLLHIVRID